MMNSKPILHLNLKKKWFNMIQSGEKKEEYREIKLYWKRIFFVGKKKIQIKGFPYKISDIMICFSNGYRKDRKQIYYECIWLDIGYGNEKWGAEKNKQYFILSLGNKIC